MRVPHFKSEIAQRELSDLGRENHASRKPSVTCGCPLHGGEYHY